MRIFVSLLVVGLLAVAVPGCDLGPNECGIFNTNPNACESTPTPMCSGMVGTGGDNGEGGAGGDDGLGGTSDQGAGGAVAASAAATGAGGAPGAGAGPGDSSGAGAGPSDSSGAGAGSARSVPRSSRRIHRRHHRGGEPIGTAVEALLGDSYVFCDGEGPCTAQCNALAAVAAGFSPSVFKFVTTIPDDGTDKGGGWQVATGTLHFSRWTTTVFPENWTCAVTVGMPLRTALNGVISATYAGNITASIATTAAHNVTAETPDLPPGIFCSTFKTEMATLFAAPPYTSIGARVN